MRLTGTRIKGIAVVLLAMAAIAGCADNAAESTNTSSGERAETAGEQPDTTGDGEVKIGVLSPGDTNDGGYYEDFVSAARVFTEDEGWELVILDQVNPADGLQQARNLCRQGVDLIAVGAVELKDALPAAEEDVCANTVFAIFGDAPELLSPHAAQANGEANETSYLTGVAAGHLLLQQGSTTAGYVAGPELDFTKVAEEDFTNGLKSVVPDAEVLTTYTGSFDDSGKAREAVVTQTGQGATIIWTYLGGATDAAASAAAEAGAVSITPGNDRCDDPDSRFAISSLYATGGYFTNVLQDFKNGDLKVGDFRVYRIGVDEWPNVKMCDSVENAAELQAEVDAAAAAIAAGDVKVR